MIRIAILMGVLYILSALADRAFLQGAEAHGEIWQIIPGFYALFGLIACLFIIVASKALGHYWLQRDEDYYDQ